MAISLSNDSKNTLSVTNETKSSIGTFDSFPGRTFADGGTFGDPGFHLSRESKNTLSVSNETKI